MNVKETAQILAIIGTVFPKVVEGGEIATSVWASVLKDLPFGKVKIATLKVLNEAEFEPRPATIRKAVEALDQHKNKTVSADEAWEEVLKNLNPYETHSWSSPQVQRAVKLVGYMNIVGSKNISFERQAFIKAYNSIIQREQEFKHCELALNLANKDVKNLLGNSYPKMTKTLSNGKVE